MRVCLYKVIHSGFIFFTQVYEEKSYVPTLFEAKKITKPEMELRYSKWTSKAFLTVKNYAALEVRGPAIDALKCSMVNEQLPTFHSVGEDTKVEILFEKAIVSSNHLKDWKIFEMSLNGLGILKCRDKLGMGVESNDLLVTSQNMAVVKFKNGPLNKLDEFAFVYPFTYGSKFKMSARIQHGDSDSILVRFSRFSDKNHTKFLHDIEKLSSQLEYHYGWRKLFIRSAQENPAVKETSRWPTTPGYQYAALLGSEVDTSGRLSLKRLCTGIYEEFFRDEEPNRRNVGELSHRRMELLKHKGRLADKMEAMNEIARIIHCSRQKNLNEEEIKIIFRVLKEAADEVKEKGSKLRNVTSLATVVDSLQRSKNHIPKLPADLASISMRDPINVLLASSVISNPISIIMPHFSAFVAILNGNIKGFELHESGATERYIKVRNVNCTIHETESRSLVTAAYICNETLKNFTMVATIYQDNALPAKGFLSSPVVGVALFPVDEPFEHDEPTEIIILFKRGLADFNHETCNLWNPDQADGWSSIGCKNLPANSFQGIKHMTICTCTHAAFFASIINLPAYFDLVPIYGCYISLLPLLIIFICLKQTSCGERFILELQISITYAIQLITLTVLFSNKIPTKEGVSQFGIPLGVMVQFCLHASFLWSTITALHSTIKYTPRLNERVSNHYLQVASLCGWVLPFTFVLITVLAENQRYERVPWSLLCYPGGTSLYILVMAPLATFMLINIGVLSILFIFERWSPQFVISTGHFILILLSWILSMILLSTLHDASIVISLLFTTVNCLYGGKLMIETTFFSQYFSCKFQQNGSRHSNQTADKHKIHMQNPLEIKFKDPKRDRFKEVFNITEN